MTLLLNSYNSYLTYMPLEAINSTLYYSVEECKNTSRVLDSISFMKVEVDLYKPKSYINVKYLETVGFNNHKKYTISGNESISSNESNGISLNFKKNKKTLINAILNFRIASAVCIQKVFRKFVSIKSNLLHRKIILKILVNRMKSCEIIQSAFRTFLRRKELTYIKSKLETCFIFPYKHSKQSNIYISFPDEGIRLKMFYSRIFNTFILFLKNMFYKKNIHFYLTINGKILLDKKMELVRVGSKIFNTVNFNIYRREGKPNKDDYFVYEKDLSPKLTTTRKNSLIEMKSSLIKKKIEKIHQNSPKKVAFNKRVTYINI